MIIYNYFVYWTWNIYFDSCIGLWYDTKILCKFIPLYYFLNHKSYRSNNNNKCLVYFTKINWTRVLWLVPLLFLDDNILTKQNRTTTFKHDSIRRTIIIQNWYKVHAYRLTVKQISFRQNNIWKIIVLLTIFFS